MDEATRAYYLAIARLGAFGMLLLYVLATGQVSASDALLLAAGVLFPTMAIIGVKPNGTAR
jgi:hypothetical protein